MSRRIRYRAGLNPVYLPVYDFLCANLPSHWQPRRGFVTFEDQASMYAQGREYKGRIITWDKAGESPYNYGCATSWAIFDGEKLALDTAPRDWIYFAMMVAKAGGVSGERLYKKDKGHVELCISKAWRDIDELRKERGIVDAMRLIERSITK